MALLDSRVTDNQDSIVLDPPHNTPAKSLVKALQNDMQDTAQHVAFALNMLNHWQDEGYTLPVSVFDALNDALLALDRPDLITEGGE